MDDDYREFEAKTVDEAIVQAMQSFRSTFENLEIQVISEGSKGLFGLVGAKTAKILARPARTSEQQTAETTGGEQPARKKESSRETGTQDAQVLQTAREIVSTILSLMNIPCSVRVRSDRTLELIGDGSGLIIGKQGQTLDALQFILNRILNRSRQEPVYVTLDTEGYRQRHMTYLKSIAIKMGQKAKRTGQSISLEKMNPYDRRIIHLALKNDNNVNTTSVGEGLYKKILIVPRKASK